MPEMCIRKIPEKLLVGGKEENDPGPKLTAPWLEKQEVSWSDKNPGK